MAGEQIGPDRTGRSAMSGGPQAVPQTAQVWVTVMSATSAPGPFTRLGRARQYVPFVTQAVDGRGVEAGPAATKASSAGRSAGHGGGSSRPGPRRL
ncbi:hypothetical protein [Streptomyces atratus]|uniref:hypothetical protein n=1 Tax=Streptomyces atratus TaxID=1893 RepID=UPI0015A6D3B6